MRYDLYLLQYNNYYNRQLKLLNTIEDYLPYLIKKLEDRNIDIVDGINTKITVNYNATDILNDTPNYLLLHDKTANKVTRWFVIEAIMNRGCQYELTIRRDVIADYFDTIRRSPCLIQKGYVDNNSVLVFNKEQQEYNKKKTKEILVKDFTDSAWIVGFIGRDAANEEDIPVNSAYKQNDIDVDFDYQSLPQSIKDYMVLPGGTVTNTITKPLEDLRNVTIKLPLELISSSAYGNNYYQIGGNYYTNGNGVGVTKPDNASESGTSLFTGYYYSVKESTTSRPDPTYIPSIWNASGVISSDNTQTYNTNILKEIFRLMKPRISSIPVSFYNEVFSSQVDNTTYNNFKDTYDGKICKIDNTYYKCRLKLNETINLFKDVNTNYDQRAVIRDFYLSDYQLENIDIHSYDDMYYSQNRTPQNVLAFGVYATTQTYYLELEQLYTDIKTVIPKTRNHLYDAPYDMFVMPYSDDFKYAYNGTIYSTDKDLYLNMAIEISQALGEKAYDIQIVPYCPFTNLADSGLSDDEWIYDFSLLSAIPITSEDGNTTYGHYYFSTTSYGKSWTRIRPTEPLLRLNTGQSYKEITQLYKYILCSPNEEAKWEFNPCMNKGILNWQYSFDYKPYASYIKLQPEWNYLYGEKEYNGLTDKRGLVYNGQYSITQLSSAWENYINNNKNYQQIFDTQINTQIKQFDVQNKAAWDTMFERSFDVGFLGLNMLTSPLRASYNVKEQKMNEELQSISLASQRKLFSYQLDNIKNQPDTLKKLTSINIDFRLYPFIEIYEASDEEKLIFRDMIRYNGMTIMATGYIENYLKSNDETFIQATLIRFNEFIGQENDYTLVQAINNELNQGIYITKEE